jgi:hypothetical protein
MLEKIIFNRQQKDINMRLFINIIFCAMTIFLITSCGVDGFSSTLLDSQIIVDGKGEDWKDIPLTYLEDLEMVIGFAHNDSALYAKFRFSDQILARKIHMRGVILWMDPQNDEEKRWGIRYRGEFSRPPANSDLRGRQEPAPEIHNGQFMVVQGEDKISTGLDYFPGVQAAASRDKNLYVFEFALPLNTTSDDVLRQLTSESKKIGFGVEIGSISAEEREMMKQSMAEGGGRRPGGRRTRPGMSGGGRPGGMMGGPGNRVDIDSEEFWLTCHIEK